MQTGDEKVDRDVEHTKWMEQAMDMVSSVQTLVLSVFEPFQWSGRRSSRRKRSPRWLHLRAGRQGYCQSQKPYK